MCNLSSRLEKLLDENSLTQKDLAEMTGLTQSAISHYIKGDRVPKGDNLFKIANVLGVSVDVLASSNDNSSELELTSLKIRLSRIAKVISLDEKMDLIRCLFEGGNEE